MSGRDDAGCELRLNLNNPSRAGHATPWENFWREMRKFKLESASRVLYESFNRVVLHESNHGRSKMGRESK